VEEYRTARSEEKIIHKKRRRYLLNMNLKNWNVSKATVRANPSIEN